MAQYLLIPLVLIRMPLLTKNLTTQEYGLWGLLNATQGLTVPFTSLGLGIAMSRFLASEKKMDEVQEGFYSVLSIRLFLSLIIALTVLLFASPIASHFFDGAVEIVRIS
ncbi:MAG: oligosaccharide flippase family protein, partial [Bacteroidetes bacterium]|nr:oligosaccharide flippase family protein [Bacteroidota bacterium]